MQAFTRIIGSVHLSGKFSTNRFIFRIVDSKVLKKRQRRVKIQPVCKYLCPHLCHGKVMLHVHVYACALICMYGK